MNSEIVYSIILILAISYLITYIKKKRKAKSQAFDEKPVAETKQEGKTKQTFSKFKNFRYRKSHRVGVPQGYHCSPGFFGGRLLRVRNYSHKRTNK